MGIKKEVMENEWIDSLTQEDFYNGYDMSEKDRTYDLNFGNSLRDKLRDLYDLLFRRRLYQVIYKNYFKQLPHEYSYVLPSKGFSLKARNIASDTLKTSLLELTLDFAWAWTIGEIKNVNNTR